MKTWKKPVTQILTAIELATHVQAAAFSICYDIYVR